MIQFDQEVKNSFHELYVLFEILFVEAPPSSKLACYVFFEILLKDFK